MKLLTPKVGPSLKAPAQKKEKKEKKKKAGLFGGLIQSSDTLLDQQPQLLRPEPQAPVLLQKQLEPVATPKENPPAPIHAPKLEEQVIVATSKPKLLGKKTSKEKQQSVKSERQTKQPAKQLKLGSILGGRFAKDINIKLGPKKTLSGVTYAEIAGQIPDMFRTPGKTSPVQDPLLASNSGNQSVSSFAEVANFDFEAQAAPNEENLVSESTSTESYEDFTTEGGLDLTGFDFTGEANSTSALESVGSEFDMLEQTDNDLLSQPLVEHSLQAAPVDEFSELIVEGTASEVNVASVSPLLHPSTPPEVITAENASSDEYDLVDSIPVELSADIVDSETELLISVEDEEPEMFIVGAKSDAAPIVKAADRFERLREEHVLDGPTNS